MSGHNEKPKANLKFKETQEEKQDELNRIRPNLILTNQIKKWKKSKEKVSSEVFHLKSDNIVKKKTSRLKKTQRKEIHVAMD